VERAGDGETALARLRTRTPDLVLCDVIMPYVDGAQVWQVLRERLQYAGVPFVLLTALERKPWFAELEAEGVVIIHKPFDIDRLVAIIDSYLDDVPSDP
jgi:CheY-like chemotaxis protein